MSEFNSVSVFPLLTRTSVDSRDGIAVICQSQSWAVEHSSKQCKQNNLMLIKRSQPWNIQKVRTFEIKFVLCISILRTFVTMWKTENLQRLFLAKFKLSVQSKFISLIFGILTFFFYLGFSFHWAVTNHLVFSSSVVHIWNVFERIQHHLG